MLTIPEEFALLTVKDEGGGFLVIAPEAVAAGFAGAAVMELALEDRIDSDLERIWVADNAPTGSPGVDLILRTIATPEFDTHADQLIGQLVGSGERVRELALNQLVERQILTREEGSLWFLRSRRYPVIDGKEIREAKLRLLEVLLRDEVPSPRDVCLLSLAQSCDIIRHIVPAYGRAHAEERLSTLVKMDSIGQSVARYVTIIQNSIAFTSYFGTV